MRAATMLGLVALLAGAAAPADPVPLKWKLKQGDEFYVRTVQEQQQTIGVLGMNKESTTTSTTVTRFKVTEAGDPGLTVEQTILKVDATGDGAEQAGKAKGATLTFKLDKDNNVTAVEGFDKYIEQIAGGNDQTAQAVKLALNEDTLKVAVEELFNPGPGKPVAAGDKWTRETKLPLGPLGSFLLNARYTLDSLDGATAKVSYDGDGTFTPGKGGAGLPAEIVKGDLKADKYTGTLTFDTAAGRLRASTQEVNLGGALTLSANGMEIELTLKQQQKGTSTVTDKMPED